MFENLGKAITDGIAKLVNNIKLSEEQIKNMITQFNDPVATKITWGPLKSGGTNFRTYVLKEKIGGQLVFESSLGIKLFNGIFIIIGMTILIFSNYNLFVSNNFNSSMLIEILTLIIIPLIFIGVGVWSLYLYSKPLVFDKQSGFYYKGKIKDNNFGGMNSNIDNNSVLLKNIHALQIISEFVRGNKSSFYSYELNLVMKDFTRINVLDHGNLSALREDATKLGLYLGVPVWDITNFKVGEIQNIF